MSKKVIAAVFGILTNVSDRFSVKKFDITKILQNKLDLDP